MLQILQLGCLDRQGVAQDRLGILHGIALGQFRQGCGRSGQQGGAQDQSQGQHHAGETAAEAVTVAASTSCAHGWNPLF